MPLKYSPMSINQQQVGSNRIQKSPITEEPAQYDGNFEFLNFGSQLVVNIF